MLTSDDRRVSESLLGASRAGSSRWWRVAVVVVLVLAILVRFVARSHLWLDEALTVNIAGLPLDEMSAALRQDGAPPLYYLLLHGWMDVFGTGTIAVRALSGLFAVAALPLIWLAGCRLAGRRVGWAAVLLLAASPFAVRYGTEARMYSLVAMLVLIGYLALSRMLERFTWPAAVLLALTTGSLALTHYWTLYLIAVVAVLVARRAGLLSRRGRSGPVSPALKGRSGPGRREARQVLLAMAAGGILFLPWLPSFIFQMGNTGTPWAGRATVGAMLDTVVRFSGGPWDPGAILSVLCYGLVALALLGRAVDGRRIELDLRTRPVARELAVAVFATMALATVVGMVTGSAFVVRYAAVVAPLFVLLLALGVSVLADPRVFRGVLAFAVVLGMVAIVPNLVGERTSAANVARALREGARPGDVVAYCPDQLGPSVSRLLSEAGLVQVTFPTESPPQLVDWVGYKERNTAARTQPFAEKLLERAGPTGTIWLVWAPNYRTFSTKCQALITDLEQVRLDATRVVKVKPKVFERPGLVRFRPA